MSSDGGSFSGSSHGGSFSGSSHGGFFSVFSRLESSFAAAAAGSHGLTVLLGGERLSCRLVHG